MKIEDWYRDNFETQLRGRYITLESIFPLLDLYSKMYQISFPGISEMGKDIPLIKIGNGPEVVLGWSQMHGNEATTTKAIFDFLKFVSQKEIFQEEIKTFLGKFTFYIFPILNPDGAKMYTRENSNDIDLNRDALSLTQRESKCLRTVFEELTPAFCLNLHDQRSIYGFENGNPATVSFLSPAANESRDVTESRKVAMHYIVKMNRVLQNYIPNQVGRYDDSFNENCVGDTFQKAGVPTILFEAGQYREDYQREKTREFIFYALLSFFDIIKSDKPDNYKNYFEIPENLKNYKDLILRNIATKDGKKKISVAIQYSEILKNDEITFIPIVDEIGDLKNVFAHKEVDSQNLKNLTNMQENLTVGDNISELFDKIDNSPIYFK